MPELSQVVAAPPRRRLAAFAHADVVGYSRLVGADDIGTARRMRRLRADLIEPLLARHGGRLLNVAGDAFLLSFESVTASVQWAIDVQDRMPDFNHDRLADQQLRLRIGIELGDAVGDGEDIIGEGVNVAARLQAICPAGGVCVSRAVHEHAHGRLGLVFAPLGAVGLKNIGRPVEAFVLRPAAGGEAAASGAERARRFGRRTRRLVGVAAGAAVAMAVLAVELRPRPAVITAADGAGASIAVLPFDNLSGDPEQAYLADGIAEDLTTDLSHLEGATVIARESAFSFKGKQVDVREVGRQLGVRWVIEGSVRKMGDVVRVNAQLVSAETGAHLWAERFDRPLRGLEVGMDDAVSQIGAALHLSTVARPGALPRRGQASDPGAFDLVLRARSVMNEPPSDVRDAIARGLFEQALRLDPSSVPAKAGVAALLARNGDLRRASALVANAEATAPDAPELLAAKFLVLRKLLRWEEAVATFRRLLETDTSAAGVVLQAGLCGPCWGAPKEAIPLLERAAQLNPRSPNSPILYIELGRMLLLAGRDADAVRWLQRASDDRRVGAAGAADGTVGADPADQADWLLAAALALDGQVEAARPRLARALEFPAQMDASLVDLRRSAMAISDPEDRSAELRIVDGLRLAGLRERLDETADSLVPSDSRLRDIDENNAPTPMTAPGVTTLLTNELADLIRAETPVLLTTAGSNPTITGAVPLYISFGGTVTDRWQGPLDVMLARLTGGDRRRPVVTFASTMNRWHARNLALRIRALGYERVYWYRGGVQAWRSSGLPMGPLNPWAP